MIALKIQSKKVPANGERNAVGPREFIVSFQHVGEARAFAEIISTGNVAGITLLNDVREETKLW